MRNGNEGFTLIEVMVTITLLAVGAIAIYHSIASYHELSEMASERNIAFFDLETALEDIRSTPFDRIVDEFPDDQPIVKFNDLHLKDEQIVVRYVNPNRDPLVISAEITWTDSQGVSMTESMHTARTR